MHIWQNGCHAQQLQQLVWLSGTWLLLPFGGIEFPEAIKQHTIFYRQNNDGGSLISINVLKFFTLIINCCAALHIIWTSQVTNNPNLVLLIMTDIHQNLMLHGCISAHCWSSRHLELNLSGSIWPEQDLRWYLMPEKESVLIKNSRFLSFDYSTLKQKYPELKCNVFFQFSQRLTCSYGRYCWMGSCWVTKAFRH